MKIKDFPVACGEFIGASDVDRAELEQAGWALVPEGIHYREGIMYAAHLIGSSMAPRIEDGDWGLFTSKPEGTRENRIVLVEDQSKIGMERYTLKKYRSKKEYFPDGTWKHDEIILFPLNRSGHSPIHLSREGNYCICGWFAGSVRQIQRVEKYRYEYISDEI